jgi:hypothetical protein
MRRGLYVTGTFPSLIADRITVHVKYKHTTYIIMIASLTSKIKSKISHHHITYLS